MASSMVLVEAISLERNTSVGTSATSSSSVELEDDEEEEEEEDDEEDGLEFDEDDGWVRATSREAGRLFRQRHDYDERLLDGRLLDEGVSFLGFSFINHFFWFSFRLFC